MIAQITILTIMDIFTWLFYTKTNGDRFDPHKMHNNCHINLTFSSSLLIKQTAYFWQVSKHVLYSFVHTSSRYIFIIVFRNKEFLMYHVPYLFLHLSIIINTLIRQTFTVRHTRNHRKKSSLRHHNFLSYYDVKKTPLWMPTQWFHASFSFL